MNQQDRAVTPVIATILMIAIVVILSATASVFFLDITDDVKEPAPNVADTTGQFVVDEDYFDDNQFVRITHLGGDSVDMEEIKIIVRADASGDDDFPKEARLINFPNPNEDDPNNIIDSGESSVGFDRWTAGRTIEFRINTGNADFRVEENNTGPEADTLEVIIVHTPSDAIISENTFSP